MKLRQYLSAILCPLLLVGTAAAMPVQAATKKIVCVGDSITEGIHFLSMNDWSNTAFTNNYPKLVAEKLGYTLYNAGISGAATVGAERVGNVDSGLDWMNHSRKPEKIQYCDVLTVMLGTNDAPNWSVRKDLYKECYTAIVNAYRQKNPNLELYILTSPYTPNLKYAALEREIVPLQKELAQELGGKVIDVYTYTRSYALAKGDFIDSIDVAKRLSVHPGEKGHQVMADIVYAGITGTELPAYILDTVTTTTKKPTTTTTKKTTTTTTTRNLTTAAGDTSATVSPSTQAPTTGRPVTKPTLSEEDKQSLLETDGDETVAAKAGLKLLAEPGTFPEGNEIAISVKPDKTQGTLVTKALASFGGVTQFIPYVISSDHQPAGAVKAVFRIPEEYDPQKTALLYVSSEGKPEILPTVLDEENGTVTASLSHFSLYVLVEGDLTETVEETGASAGVPVWVWFAIGGVAAVALAIVVILLVMKKKSAVG